MDWLTQFEDVSVKFLLAVVLSGLLGLERERKGRAAGLRTHVVVCLGSTLTMIVADYLARDWAAAHEQIWLDRGRIAAGILTGIGFIGAGTIINRGSVHRGLTTAAMLWLVAGLGIAIGAGYFLVAVCGTVFALASVLVLEPVSGLLPAHMAYVLGIRFREGLLQIGDIESYLKSQGCKVMAARIQVEERGQTVDVTFDIASRRHIEVEKLVKLLHDKFAGIQRITVER
ncbi:MAG: methyltransferase [Candidatus Hydrogenedentota bacterium]